MNGVEILAEVPGDNLAGVAIFAVICIFAFLGWAWFRRKHEEELIVALGLLIISSLVFGITLGVRNEPYYIAVVDESASYTQLTEKYKVLEHYDSVYFLNDVQ